MDTASVLSTRFPSNSNLTTARPEIPSNTLGRPNRLPQDHTRGTPSSTASSEVKLLTLDEMCDWYIRCVLIQCEGNKEATARVLGIGRTSLYRYLKKLALENGERNEESTSRSSWRPPERAGRDVVPSENPCGMRRMQMTRCPTPSTNYKSILTGKQAEQ